MREDDTNAARRPDDDERLLARAFSADAEALTEEERVRLEEILVSRRKTARDDAPAAAASDAESSSPPEPGTGGTAGDEPPRRQRVDRRVLLVSAGVAIAAVAFGAGVMVPRPAAPTPYLSAEDMFEKTGQQIEFPVEIAAPTRAGFDAGSAYLSAIIDDNAIWIGTQDDGARTCFYADLGVPGADVEGCAPGNAPVSGIAVTSDDPRLPPEDRGQYTLNVYQDALPFVSFSRAE